MYYVFKVYNVSLVIHILPRQPKLNILHMQGWSQSHTIHSAESSTH